MPRPLKDIPNDGYTSVLHRKGVNRKMRRAIEANDGQAILDMLTVRQRRFVEEYMISLNGMDAVLKAGYKTTPRNAQSIATCNLKHPGIRTALDILMTERKSNTSVTEDYVLQKIVRIIERCEQEETFNAQAVLRAAELLGKHLAMFTEKHEVTGADGGAIKMEQLRQDADAFTSAIASLARREDSKSEFENKNTLN